MPALDNKMSNGGPSVGGRNGGSSFINGKGNASAFGNGIAQMNGDGSIANECTDSVKDEVAGTKPEVNEDPLSAILNGHAPHDPLSNGLKLNRAEEMDDLLSEVRKLIIPFIKNADNAAAQKHTGNAYVNPATGKAQQVLVDYQEPAELAAKLDAALPDEGRGKEGILTWIEQILANSVNTWDQGFMDKLFSTNTPIGVISDLILSILNTNLHVYQVSPALTIVEKTTARALAGMFGLTGPHAGGFTCQGGSSSNLTSMVVARNTLFPECAVGGNKHDFVVFTSVSGHYSVEKNAMICGLGSSAVWAVPADTAGRMKPSALNDMIVKAKAEGKTPFYVNATAGTTVRGAYEPLEDISAICKAHGLWMHVDASFGGPVVFSRKHRHNLAGSHLADSLTVNPHKMMNVPSTCSFLLGPDVRIFNKANSTKAGYLFHSHGDGEVWDLADLTLQCGRRADSFKLALAWQYHGTAGFERQVDHSFAMAAHLYQQVTASSRLELVTQDMPSCLQVCFYYRPGGGDVPSEKEVVTKMTADIVHQIIPRGFMVDYAPGDRGSFFRVVVNWQTQPGTVEGLVKAIETVGMELYG
ncbi:Glutamate decarboxylase-like protein [Emericellopsis cladophorae]|uniref:Glutamate decarboxylase-like protein n=1 Tax=Emericellopsis cladophorae TaxID=2686198 RepID=A0A9P9Y027_9HYPO|nr:Glutamate decarboxylase-like protein [Emericellopsis cladophorae]KAI6780811.1 Glutamate decarboxylase-like protein [Emericellopsis cladophorae]